MKAVRCGNKKATPYLRQHVDLFTEGASRVIDIACGNGRNSEYLKQRGMHVMPLDAKADYGTHWVAGQALPLGDGLADCILCNYLLMFLDIYARNDVYNEITRVAHVGSKLMVELEQVKQSLTNDVASLLALNDEVVGNMLARGWRSIHGRRNHYIFEKIV